MSTAIPDRPVPELTPAVVVDHESGRVLMVAWMNAEAWELTRSTGFVHFWSRSRNKLWKKGETSGNTLAVRELRLDCDADTVLVVAEPAGPACHTGKPSCFYRRIDADPAREDQGPRGAPAAIVDRVEAVLRARRDSATAEKSYTRSLLDGGFPKILAKIAEESDELAAELPDGAREAVVHETADLLFHVLVGLVARDIPVAEVWAELERRFGTGGHEEKRSR
jgi:phosphoribosyl-AMP cyclohydrolase / phosphoribosyl-ATP pyrophosphohydrolase